MKNLFNVWIITWLGFSASVMATGYYVNPNGNDSWSGSFQQPNSTLTDGPFKTLERAKQAIRTLKKTNTFNDKVTVNIAAGLYYLNQPLKFNLMDSGLPGREILWQGDPGGLVTISAGMPITCKKRDATIWDCPLTKLPASTVYFDTGRIKGNVPVFELFVNGQKLQLARWPDKDWAHIKLPVDQKTQFTVMETLPKLTGDIKAAQVHTFSGTDWYDQYIGIDSVDQPGNSIKLSATTLYPLASGRRFYIQNLPSLLDAPGEWIYDAAVKKITFISPANLSVQVAILSSLPNIISADGINNLIFKNIGFQHSTGTAISLKNAGNVVLDQLEISNIGGKGVDINGGQNVQLTNSKIHHTGAHGVVVAGGDRNTLQASGHVIHNNHIHHMGTTILTYTPGIEVNGVGNKITHNLLEQGAGSAILITGNDHLIEKNEISHFCLQAADCGAIYSGRNWSWRGNVISNNYIHDIIGYGMVSVDVEKNQVIYQSSLGRAGVYGAVGVYLDDGVSGFDVSGNIIENAGWLSIQIGGGRDTKVVNNYIKTNDYAIYLDARDNSANQKTLDESPYKTTLWQQRYPELAMPINHKNLPEGNKIERNIIVTTRPDGKSLLYYVPKDSIVIANNILWSTTGNLLVDYRIFDATVKTRNAASWQQWISEGIEQGSIVADPCVTIVNKQMITCPGSPVNAIGFKPLPTDIGLIQ
jgi:hypothetical protein